MEVFILPFILFCLVMVRPTKPNENHHGVKAFLPIRGICAILIITHHLSQHYATNLPFLNGIFDNLGYIIVGVFFAISGFALTAQYAKQGDKYLKGFNQKRLISVLIPYLIVTLLMILVYLVIDLSTGVNFFQDILDRFINMFTSGKTIVEFSWYVEAIIILYLLFYCAFKFAKNIYVRYAIILAGLIAYTAVCVVLNYGVWWYISIPAFPLGMLMYDLSSIYKAKSNKFTVYVVLAITLTCIALVFVVDRLIGEKRFLIETTLSVINVCASVIFVFAIMCLLKFNSKVLNYLGSRSYEIYLTQGVSFVILSAVGIQNVYLYSFIVYAGTLLLAEGVYRLNKLIISTFSSKRNGKQIKAQDIKDVNNSSQF